jgi:hypothetical protein
MQKVIRNQWLRKPGDPFECVRILSHRIHPEGLDVDRIRFFEAGLLKPRTQSGHIMSVLRGAVKLFPAENEGKPLHLEAGMHLYAPPEMDGRIEATAGTELLHVSSPADSQARGEKIILRDERFLAACANDTGSLRWIFTPQYLSRRIFLHHDLTLLSVSGHPVSWFHTTMFDVTGLPKNEDGESVFKMSYNSRTEFNVCYEVEGAARVRMALHPYRNEKQAWGEWLQLDGDSTYHLNEAANGREEERYLDEQTRSLKFLRNKHEVYIHGGHVSLCCLFDPAPTGMERHKPGEYSDYEPLSQVIADKAYHGYRAEMARYDEMVDRLSMAKARGELTALHDTPIWSLYRQGIKAQYASEKKLLESLAAEGNGRERVISRWMLNPAQFGPGA